MPDLELVVAPGLSGEQRAQVEDLLADVEAGTAEAPLSEHKALALTEPAGPDVLGVLAIDPASSGPLRGYAQVARHPGSWGIEAVVRPSAADPTRTKRALVGAALREIARRGGGTVQYWVRHPGSDDDDLAGELGLSGHRDLLQLRVPLPLGAEQRARTHPLAVRPFVPGQDEDRWLEVNNRAFAGHPEQGAWDRAELARREDEPWFDPAGFLLAEVDGRLVGSCWTKVHADADPPMGEIYVISVDPSCHQRGLGRALTVAGLDWLTRQGLGVGMLYVDADNSPAMALYRSLGFLVDHLDRAYEGAVAPAGG